MKCRHCGAEIIRIGTISGPTVCDAAPITYWHRHGDAGDIELLTQNGIRFYGRVIPGELQTAVGIAYAPHTCHQRTIVLLGRDSHDRPVYEAPDGTLYVDTDPRKDSEPDICTKQFNAFDGEPCDPVDGHFTFIPHRDTW